MTLTRSGLMTVLSRNKKIGEFNRRHKEFIQSLKSQYYVCPECIKYEEFYYTPFQQDMVNHFNTDHYDGEDFIIKEKIEPSSDMEYIILSKLIRVSKSKEFRRRKYFTISNIKLYNELIKESDLPFSNQKPRKILDELGLLIPYDNQRTKPVVSHPKTRTRMYNINADRLKEVVSNTKYDDLKIKLALRDSLVNTIRPVIEPSRPSRENHENINEKTKESREPSEPSRPSRKNVRNDDEKSRETRELDDDDIDWNVG